MSFTDHKITSFQHKIADLADQPTLPPDELKSRFDACPEELRQSLNAVCDDAARLEARVEGIVVDTFGDTIDKEMLSDELAAELDGKATQTALAAEAAAREAADDALDTRLTAAETALPLKCECYFGMFNGDGEDSQFISLGFTPKAVLVLPVSAYFTGPYEIYSAMALPSQPSVYSGNTVLAIEENGFRAYSHDGGSSTAVALNSAGGKFYIAFK